LVNSYRLLAELAASTFRFVVAAVGAAIKMHIVENLN
jgi:hypothetical protein